MEEYIEEKPDRPDPLALAINTPINRLAEFTIIPIGATNYLAMSDTIQHLGKRNYWRNITPFQHYQLNIFRYNRSRGGKMIGGLIGMATTQLETSATTEAEGRKYIL